MQSNQNTFRLGRLSHTSDFRKPSISQYTNNPKQTLKFAALSSINRGVKYNDLSFITGRQLPKLRKQPQEGNDNLQYNAAHENLTSIRRKHDNINKQKIQLQAKINLLKQQKQKYSTSQNQFVGNKTQGSEKVKLKQDQLSNIKNQYDQSQWNKKVYQMMAQRIKTDKVVYDQRKYNLQKQLSHLRKQLKIFVKQGTGINEQTDRTAKVYEKLIRQLQSQQNDRSQHLNNLQQMLQQRQYVNQSNQMRKNQIQQIAAKASQDKDQNQKNWINILHVHKFVHQLLRTKMNRQMQKFSIVQMAFKNIKIATGVSDSQTLITKYLTKQSVYGQLLGKIADNQRRITQLKSQNDELVKQSKQLEQQKRSNDSTKKLQINLRNDIKLYEQISSKFLTAQLNGQKIRSWVMKNLKKIFNIEKSNEDVSVGRNYKQIGLGFKKYLQNISKELDKCNQVELSLNHDLDNSQLVSENSKVFRVKPKTKKMNYSGEQIENQFEEEQLTNISEQQDIITNQRLQIIKQNEKFMKDLKRKMEEIKKIKIESSEASKKKATTSPQKKPIEEQ